MAWHKHKYVVTFYLDLSMIWKMTMRTNCPILIYDKKIIVSWNTLWVRIPLRRGVLDTPLCDKACQWLTAGRWFSPGTPFSSTNKTDRHDIAEILLKKALNTTTLTLLSLGIFWFFFSMGLNKCPQYICQIIDVKLSKQSILFWMDFILK